MMMRNTAWCLPARGARGFTLLEVMLAAGLFMAAVGLYAAGALALSRLMLDVDPKVRAREAHLEVLKADLMRDVALAERVIAIDGLILRDGIGFRSTTFQMPLNGRLLAANADVFAALQQGATAAGSVLEAKAPDEGVASSVLFLNADGGVGALWEILNLEVDQGNQTGLQTVVNRYSNEGGATLLPSRRYVQFIPQATVLDPGGAGEGRPLAAAANLSGGWVEVYLPSPQRAGDLLAITGVVKPESANATAQRILLRSPNTPRL